MGMERLQALGPFVKDALHHTARVASVFCFLHVTGTYICSVAKLVGPSMLPTFNHGNIVLTERITSRVGKVGSGDVVLIRSPEEPSKIVAKRVKGVDGDAVSYVVDPEKDEQKTVVIPKGHVWVEGDNLHKSRDSREFGPVPYALIHSRVYFVVWPPEDFRLIGSKFL